jgi:DNA-binding MarR family transcriptional regulator
MPLRLIPGVHRATHRIGLYIDGATDLGVSQGEAHLLAHLLEAGACSIAELHAAFAHKRSTLTSYLDRLEGRGLVVRDVHPEDRRSFLVELTAKGKTVAGKVHGALLALERAALAGFSDDDVAVFQAVLEAIQKHSEAAGEPPKRRGAKR